MDDGKSGMNDIDKCLRAEAEGGEKKTGQGQGGFFTVVEPEAAATAETADRILAQVLAGLSTLREIVAVATDEKKRAAFRPAIEELKTDIARLTGALAQLPLDELGMTEAEFSEVVLSIEQSVAEVSQVMTGNGEPRTVEHCANEETLSRWFEGMSGTETTEEE